jgi:hypothetical protein
MDKGPNFKSKSFEITYRNLVVLFLMARNESLSKRLE